MESKDVNRSINRRRLLRRAGTVAAVVAGGGAVAAIASPAGAADGLPLDIGEANTGTNTTSLTAGSTANPTLRLVNGANGAPLALDPLNFDGAESPSLSSPVGSLYADDYGDFYGIGDPDEVPPGPAGPKYINQLYSPTWATMTIPLTPVRWVDTRFASTRVNLVSGSFTLDSSKRIVAHGTSNPDAVIDVSPLFLGGFGAVQANLTVLSAPSSGFAALWDQGGWPGTSSINYPASASIANFTQTLIGDQQTISFKTQRNVVLILDIVGFVVTDPFAQFAQGITAAAGARGAARWQKRRPATG